MKTKISELQIRGINSTAVEESLVQQIGGSGLIVELLSAVVADPGNVKRSQNLGRKTLLYLLEAIEEEGYKLPQVPVTHAFR